MKETFGQAHVRGRETRAQRTRRERAIGATL
jgi:hypothetical protein